MALLFSRSFHCLWLPCCNVPPKSSERLRIYAPIPLPKPWVSFTHHTRLLPNATSSPNSDPEDFDILSSTGIVLLLSKTLAFFISIYWVFLTFPFWLVGYLYFAIWLFWQNIPMVVLCSGSPVLMRLENN